MRGELEALGLEILPFSVEEAEIAARLWSRTRRYGLSLGDRACIAAGIHARARVLTTDRSWLRLDVGVRIEALRGPS